MSGGVIAAVICILIAIAVLLCVYFYCIGPFAHYFPCCNEDSTSAQNGAPTSAATAAASEELREQTQPLNNEGRSSARHGPSSGRHLDNHGKHGGVPPIDPLDGLPSYEESQKMYQEAVLKSSTQESVVVSMVNMNNPGNSSSHPPPPSSRPATQNSQVGVIDPTSFTTVHIASGGSGPPVYQPLTYPIILPSAPPSI